MLYLVADSGLPNLTRIQVHKTPDIIVRGGGRYKTCSGLPTKRFIGPHHT
jgi:hypothetical protein